MTPRPFIAFLLSAISIMGGHVYNGRFDRVLLFAGVTTLGFSLAWSFGPTLFEAMTTARFDRFFGALGIAYLAVALVSAFVSALDAARQTPGSFSATQARVGGVLLSMTLGYGIVAAVVLLNVGGSAAPSALSAVEADAVPADASTFRKQAFASVHFGGGFRRDQVPTAPPAGDARLSGRLRRANTALDDAEVIVSFNGKYQATATVDSAGYFEVPVPQGKWQLNSIGVTVSGAPKAGVALRTGREAVLSADSHYRAFPPDSDGLVVDASTASRAPAIEAEIVDAVELTWPPARDGDDAAAADASSAIRWQAYPGAVRYHVQLWEVTERTRSSWSSRSVTTRTVSTTDLPIAEFASESDPGKSHEYYVAVYAFDASGRYLSETSDVVHEASFMVRGVRLADEPCPRTKHTVAQTRQPASAGCS